MVFLPLIYLQGLARAFFGVQAFAIVTSLAASLLFSLTVTPVLSGNRERRNVGEGLAPSREGGGVGRSPGAASTCASSTVVLARPALAVAAALAVTILAGVAFVRLPRELVPDGAARDLVVRYRLAQDLTPEAARRLGTAVEEQAARALSAENPNAWPSSCRHPSRGRTARRPGRRLLGFPDAASAERARPRLRAALSRLPDVEVWVEPRPSAFVETIERAGRRLEVVATRRHTGAGRRPRPRAAERAARRRRLRERPGPRARPGPPQPAPPRLGRAPPGRPRRRPATLEAQVREALGDQTAGRVRIDGVEPEILVRAVEPEDPALLPVAGQGGHRPPGALARLDAGARPPVLEREDGRPAARPGVRYGARETARRRCCAAWREGGAASRSPPAGRRWSCGAPSASSGSRSPSRSLLVFLTVAALYESFRIPLVVMTTVPVALGGALGLLLLTGQTLNVLSFLGLILLAGIVVNNAIVLVHRIEEHLRAGERRGRGDPPAGAERYRPILMTTLTHRGRHAPAGAPRRRGGRAAALAGPGGDRRQ